MTKSITLYWHIGAPKTGSTALQRFLEQHSLKLLKDYKVLYPNFYDSNVGVKMTPGVNYWQGKHFENHDSQEDLALFQKCVDFAEKRSLRGIVISHEALLNKWPDRVALLANALNVNFKVICYVRRQDYHLESAWKQIGYRFCSAKDILHHTEGWGGWRKTDWYQQLAPWAKNFGIENVLVRPYEKEQLPDGIFHDFLRAIDINWEGEAELIRKANVNSGFSRDVMEFLYLNRDFYSGPGDQRLYVMLNQLLDSEYSKKPFESYNLLSPMERIELLQKFESSNQKVAREYLKREDGRLFYEAWPAPDDSWEPYNGLDVEKLVPLMTSLIYGLYENQRELDRKLNRNFKDLGQRIPPSILGKLKMDSVRNFIKKFLR